MQVIYFGVVLMLVGCFSTKKEREIKDEIFSLKTKIMELEKVTSDKSQSVDVSSKRLASTHTELDRVNMELQRIKGELESVKLALKTGEMPGADPEAESIAKRLRDLDTRVAAIEGSSKATPVAEGPSATSNSKTAESGKPIAVAELRTAFNNKKFSFVAENAAGVIQRLKTKASKEEISYLEAESLFRIGRYRDAALKYHDFTEVYANSTRVAHSKLRLGDCFRMLGEGQTAKSYYKEIVTKYPKSEEAKTSQQQLEEMGEKGASNQKSQGKVKYSNQGNRKGAKTDRG